MRWTAITAVLGAALMAAPVVTAAELPQLPVDPAAASQLPQLPVDPPVEIPRLPAVPDVPALPELPDPPAPPVDPPDVPAPPSGGAAPEPGAAAPSSAAPPAPVTGSPRAPTTARRTGPRRQRAAARPQTGGRAAQGAPRATRTPAPDRVRAVQAVPVAAAATPEPPRRAERLADELVELVEALPAGVLWALGILALLALWLAGSAFWQSRKRAALERQRVTLLDDIGLLSGALLPPVPEDLDGLTVSAAYRPADGPGAGGDFYDVFALEDGRVGVLLGDVSGHGRASLRHAALARFTLRTLLADGHPVGEALAHADRLLARDLRPHFVTVIAAVYDLEGGRLTYAKAGHPPPIVLGTPYDPDDETPAPPIGLGVGEVWPEYHVDLVDGASVCLFTDGLEDARVDGTRIGRDHVERLLAAHDVPCAERLLADIGAVADSVGDDTAAIVLRRSPVAQAADLTEAT